ncbi:MAG TPA: NHL repeat-containing protein [Chloroflexota bacterium]|nr:NHL repeat-containing protein [Chloroflexota bacterium]
MIKLARALALLGVLLALPFATFAARGPTGDDIADAVYGQASFASRSCANPPTATSACKPAEVAVDGHGNLWVADQGNNRVLMFPRGKAIPTRVVGQFGSFTTHDCNQKAPANSYPSSSPASQYTLCNPGGVAVDAQGTLYISDTENNRILIYRDAAHKPADMPADAVIGQPNFHTVSPNTRTAFDVAACPTPSPGHATACTLDQPQKIGASRRGDLVAADRSNNRVLLWKAATIAAALSHGCTDSCGIAADRSWGQYGSMTSTTANNPTPPHPSPRRCSPITRPSQTNACALWLPYATTLDTAGDLFVADGQDRVLEYDRALANGQQAATLVYGQGGNFTTRVAQPAGPGSLQGPFYAGVDPRSNVWIADTGDFRVLEYPPLSSRCASPTLAIRVLGQKANVAGHTENAGGMSASALGAAQSIAFDSAGTGYVTDTDNNRVLRFDALATPFSAAFTGSGTVVTRRAHAGKGTAVKGFLRITVRASDIVSTSGHLRLRAKGLSRSGTWRGCLVAGQRSIRLRATINGSHDGTVSLKTDPQHGALSATLTGSESARIQVAGRVTKVTFAVAGH